jgi:hypothetical protein
MKTNIDEIVIDGQTYVPKSQNKPSEKLDGLEYVIVRTYSAGVFAGYLKKKEGQNAIMLNARRLYYWDGAATLSQLAMEGVSKPQNCKFPCEVEKVELDQVIEVLQTTEKCQKSINSVGVWKV